MKKLLKRIYKLVLKILFPSVFENYKITFKTIFFQKILGFNRKAYWPMHFSSKVSGVENIHIGIMTCPGLSPGCYIQGGGQLIIGDYTLVAPNVGIISANHDVYDLSKHEKSIVRIGSYCWLGMNSMVLPGVELGDFTVVGAGSVVTRSFKEGYCVIAGNPARKIKDLEPGKCVKTKNEYEYIGYFRKEKFEKKVQQKIFKCTIVD